MIVKFNGNHLVVKKLIENKRLYKEPTVWYHIKKELNKQGYDFIKKELAKDGHMVNDGVYYIRSRDKSISIYQSDYMADSIVDKYNSCKAFHLTTDRKDLLCRKD